MTEDPLFENLEDTELDRQSREDESALREVFGRTAARSERGFVSEAIAAVVSPAMSSAGFGERRTPVKRGWGTIAFPVVLAAAAILLFGLLLRAPNEAGPQSAGGAPDGVFAGEITGVEHKPVVRHTWHIPPSCVEVRRRDLQRRLERKRKRLEPITPILLNPQAVPKPMQHGITPS